MREVISPKDCLDPDSYATTALYTAPVVPAQPRHESYFTKLAESNFDAEEAFGNYEQIALALRAGCGTGVGTKLFRRE